MSIKFGHFFCFNQIIMIFAARYYVLTWRFQGLHIWDIFDGILSKSMDFSQRMYDCMVFSLHVYTRIYIYIRAFSSSCSFPPYSFHSFLFLSRFFSKWYSMNELAFAQKGTLCLFDPIRRFLFLTNHASKHCLLVILFRKVANNRLEFSIVLVPTITVVVS